MLFLCHAPAVSTLHQGVSASVGCIVFLPRDALGHLLLLLFVLGLLHANERQL